LPTLKKKVKKTQHEKNFQWAVKRREERERLYGSIEKKKGGGGGGGGGGGQVYKKVKRLLWLMRNSNQRRFGRAPFTQTKEKGKTKLKKNKMSKNRKVTAGTT